MDSNFCEFEEPGEFEFTAVKPVRRIFVSRLPQSISEDVLKRHILKRVPECAQNLQISILPTKKNVNYSSVLISVGSDERVFQSVNSNNFWPPGTIVHKHRIQKPGFRSKKGSNWRHL